MVEIGKNNNLNDVQLKELFLLGYNHDIGYTFGNNENHNIIGGEMAPTKDVRPIEYEWVKNLFLESKERNIGFYFH